MKSKSEIVSEKTLGRIAYDKFDENQAPIFRGRSWDGIGVVKRNAWQAAALAVRDETINQCTSIIRRYECDGDWDADTLEAIGRDIRSLKEKPE